MAKLLLLVTLLVATSLSMPNQEILQKTLNGIFIQNHLSEPTTVIPCIDEGSAKIIVDFITRSL